MTQPKLFDIGRDPSPFYRWTGSKREYVPLLLALIGSLRGQEYRECFLGGGAVALQVLADKSARRVVVNDSNTDLIATWRVLRDCPEEVLRGYREHRERSCEEYFYTVRAQRPTTDPDRAARFLYLVGAGHCGLWRENLAGEMNTPFGHACELFTSEARLIDVARLLQESPLVICHGSFEALFENARGVFIYADPPYLPLDATSFVAYGGKRFTIEDHRTLARLSASCGATVAVSNHDTPLAREIYAGARVMAMNASRGFNAAEGAQEAVFIYGAD